MKNLTVLFAGWIAAFGAIFSANVPPSINPVVRFNEHPFVKRLHAKIAGRGIATSIFDAMRSVLNAPLRFGGFGSEALTAGLLNTFYEPLPTYEFQAARDKADLPESLYIEEITCRISGNVTVAGGAADGTLQTEPVARLIDEIRVVWDGFDLVGPISGRDMVALSRRVQSQGLTTEDVTAPGVQNTDFSLPFVIPFNRRYLADPFDTVLPPLQVDNSFELQIKWNTSVSNANAATTQGSGAIVDGGDRDVVLSDVQLVAVPKVARNGKKPYMLPVISTLETRQISAADPRLPLDMRSPLPFDGVLFRAMDGAFQDPENLISEITFKSSQTRILNNVPIDVIRAIEEQTFPAVQNASENGTHFVLFADGGKLGNAVNPAELSNPTFEFNANAPGTNPGFVRAIIMELMSLADEGVTRF